MSSVTDDSAEETAEDPYAGLDHVFRTYVVNGADGIARLYEDLRRHRRDPLLDRFCTELHLVLTDPAAPSPAASLNAALEEAGIDQRFTTRQTLSELATLWENLELTRPDEDRLWAPSTEPDPAQLGRPAWMLVRGDPMVALRTWLSVRLLLMFAVGSAVAFGAWHLSGRTDGMIRDLLWGATLLGFVTGAVGGGALWLRRARYQNPEAFLSKRDTPDR